MALSHAKDVRHNTLDTSRKGKLSPSIPYY